MGRMCTGVAGRYTVTAAAHLIAAIAARLGEKTGLRMDHLSNGRLVRSLPAFMLSIPEKSFGRQHPCRQELR